MRTAQRVAATTRPVRAWTRKQRGRAAALAAAAFAFVPAAAAQFPQGEVSGPGRERLFLTRSGATFEDLSGTVPGVSYNIYRRRPGEGFRCIAAGLPGPRWNGDSEAPTDGAWWYTVNADDGTAENRHGSSLPVEWRCCAGQVPVEGTPPLRLEPVPPSWVFLSPVHLAAPPTDRSRLFVVEADGTIAVLVNGVRRATPFLDIRAKVMHGVERGLLCLAFHPGFASNGRFFVFYTSPPDGDAVVEEYRVSADPDLADPASGRVLLTYPHSSHDHYAGQLAFGPRDGYLYIGMGDNLQSHPSQDLGSLLGKLLRIDVDSAAPYAVPPDNPFVATPGARGEIWAYGLRNPWRFSFDRLTDELYLADVGHFCGEELDVAAPLQGGQQYGWPTVEGNGHCPGACGSSCSLPGMTLPVFEYTRAEGCAIIGGHVYRGCRLPGYRGRYFFADYCGSWVDSLRVEAGAASDRRRHFVSADGILGPASFGVDVLGEIYVVNVVDGRVFRLVP